jgi:poly(3-hydroxybutyrate) depolymerase
VTLLTGEQVASATTRTYSVEVPAAPPGPQVPAILVFHGGGQEAETIAQRWGIDPPAPVPGPLRDYLLVFPETHPGLAEQWVHRGPGDGGLPSLDLAFVADLVAELTTHRLPTGSAAVPEVTADPALLYVAGFSNGGGLVWQLLNSDLSAAFRGFAAVGKALDPEKSQHYRRQLAVAGLEPRPAPVCYLQGTADRGFRPPFTWRKSNSITRCPFSH